MVEDRYAQRTQGICAGQAGCTYTPKYLEIKDKLVSGCDRAWTVYRRALYDCFKKANPDLAPHQSPKCAAYLDPRHRHSYRKIGTPCSSTLGKDPLDHLYGWRFLANAPYLVIIAHPYSENKGGLEVYSTFKSDMFSPEDIDCLFGGVERSWYHPNYSYLAIIGMKHVLSEVNLDYPLPDSSLRPIGCIRWGDS